jgi:outer membrane lipoprotein-sorting protein
VTNLKHVAGLVGFLSTVVGTLLALGIIQPLGGTENALAAAAGTTADAGSAKAAFVVQMPLGAETLTMTGDGAYDFRTGRGKVTYHLPPELASLWRSSTVKTIFDGDTTYMYLPQLSAGRPWIRSETGGLSAGSQSELDVFLELGPDDPSQILGFLELGGDVETIGEESLFGTETTHYRATVDVDDLVDHAPADVQEKVRAAAERLQGEGTLSVEVWIDDADFVRRIALEGQLGDVGEVTMTMDLYDFGTEVGAKVPPPSKVLDTAAPGL